MAQILCRTVLDLSRFLSKDYSPVKLEVAYNEPGISEDALNFARPVFVSEVEYDLQGNIWLPRNCLLLDFRKGNELQANWQFIWEVVHEALDPLLFSVEGLKAKGGTLVTDNRLGEGMVKSVIPRDGIDDLPRGFLKLLGKENIADSPRSSLWIILNVCILAILLTIIIAKRLHSYRTNP